MVNSLCGTRFSEIFSSKLFLGTSFSEVKLFWDLLYSLNRCLFLLTLWNDLSHMWLWPLLPQEIILWHFKREMYLLPVKILKKQFLKILISHFIKCHLQNWRKVDIEDILSGHHSQNSEKYNYNFHSSFWSECN